MELWCETSDGSSGSDARYEDEESGRRCGSEAEEAGEAGCSLLEAFEGFEIRAEKRTLELLESTDRELFEPSMDGDGFLEVDLPAHVYYSDHYRQTKPPDFETWRKQFPYFQVTGASVNTATDDAFGHWVPAPQSDLCPVNHDEQICSELEIVGAACLQPLPVDTSSLDEEIIACDGVMEEIEEEDTTNARAEFDTEKEEHTPRSVYNGCLSPRSSRVEESFNARTTTVYSSTVASVLTPVVRVLLEHRQNCLRIAREEREAKIQEEIARQKALEEEARVRECIDMAAEEEFQVQLEEALAEGERREVERLAQLEEEERAENDEEEIKIRTLAYTHTREWYQPNKKCFSHRGRQFTYLKPVLKTKEEQDQKQDSPPRDYQKSKCIGNRLSKPQQGVERSPSVPSRVVGIIEDPPRSVSTALKTEASQSGESNDDLGTERVRLPLIAPPSTRAKRTSDDAFGRSRSKQNVREAVRAPSNVYVTAPYRIPPPLVADTRPASKPASRPEVSNQNHDARSEK